MVERAVPAGEGGRYSAFGFELHYQNMRWIGDNDIIVASIAGAGQSLLGNILLELSLNYVNLATETILPDGSTVPATDAVSTARRQRLAATHERDRATATGDRGACRRWPRFLKTHLPAEEFAGRAFFGVWMLVRDPRDALYSWYRYRLGFTELAWEKAEGSFEEFLRRPGFTGKCPVDDWSSFYTGWLQRASRCQHAAVIRFEDLKRRPFETMRDALGAIGLQLPDEQVHRAIERSTFEAMRAHEVAVARSDPDRPPEARIMRSGKVEEWREWMTPELAAYFADDELRAVARRFNYIVAAQ